MKALLLALALSTFLAAPMLAAAAATHHVAAASGRFDPAMLVIEAGDTVVWTNTVNSIHTVSDTAGAFDSGEISRGQTFSHTFEDPGVVVYRCKIHTLMWAAIVVQP